MPELRYTLLTDGSSDRGLLHILTWLIRESLPDSAVQEAWADLRRLPRVRDLSTRMQLACEYYPCELLFVHRDAEGTSRDDRAREIGAAYRESGLEGAVLVCVVPVRMTEAWLMFDEQAIRNAAGNPRGTTALALPRMDETETIGDPKALLHELLTSASELTGRRRKKFHPPTHASHLPSYIRDFSRLRDLPSFQALEIELRGVMRDRS